MGTREVLHSSETNEWYTPAEYIEAARAVMGSIDLDPASCLEANEVVRAREFYTIDDDGLSKPWRASTVWLNPPYGKTGGASNAALWTAKLLHEVQLGNVEQAILLVSAATGAVWFRPLFDYPICFITPRIRFWGHNKYNPTHYHAAVYFGPNRDSFQEIWQEFGAIVERRRPRARTLVYRPRRHGKIAELSEWIAKGERTTDHREGEE